MKYIVLTLFCFVFFEGTFGCYQAAYGDVSPSLLLKLLQPLLENNRTKVFWRDVCGNKQKLNDCIGKDLIQNCLNIENVQKLPFAVIDAGAKIVIANFLHIDHICDKFFKFSDVEYNCLRSEVRDAQKNCPNATLSCESIDAALNCGVETSYKECGKVVGCFQKKSSTLTRCYNAILCGGCDGISSTNNLIDALCDDDEDESIQGSENGTSFVQH
uniref:Seminal fluid protein n=1 Tax=Panagrolaimus sp. ES5 TaxID=591445 RepID=A0AC34GXT1_9BILA